MTITEQLQARITELQNSGEILRQRIKQEGARTNKTPAHEDT